MRIPVRSSGLEDRDEGGNSNKALIYISIVVVVAFLISAVAWLVVVRLRRGRRRASSKKSTDKLPSLFSWSSLWNRPRRNDYSRSLQENEMDGNSRRDSQMTGALDPERQSVSGVDRHTSVRSVMTLPAYSPAARENERILGREGERGGIDTVVEFPETQDEEELRREDEMEGLYQIRLARRQEAREREQRRQERREARARGDSEALAEIRRRAEVATEESVSQVLIAQHQSKDRERRVSSVQYGDLGVARHDGTRLRANSAESDNRPLLDSAASISGNSGRSRALSNNTLRTHYRGPSASSVVSSRASEEFEFPEASRSRSNDNDSFEAVPLSHPRSRSASRVVTPVRAPSIDISRDSMENIPMEDAPAYEDPPNYESPIRTRAPQLPNIERLPSIRVTSDVDRQSLNR